MSYKIKMLTLIVIVLSMSCDGIRVNHSHTHDGSIANNHTHNYSLEVEDYFGSYTLNDATYGTNTIVTVNKNTRTMVTNALPNHETGEFPSKGNPNTISAQHKTYTFPVNPKYTGKAQWMREPGIALNGIKFEPQTAEVVECETGENYRVEAIQDVIDLGLDFNHAHVQPTGAYHYHGTPTSIIEKFDTGNDLVHIGFAHDGFPMYYSKSGLYKPSFKLLTGNREGEDCTYENPMVNMDISVGGHHDGTYGSDYEYVSDSGDLDECNGIIVDGNYMYFVTNEFPYVGRCLMGEVEQEEHHGPPAGQNGRGGRPNLEELFKLMDTNTDTKISKDEAKGPLAQSFKKIDKNSDGFITKEELKNMPKPERRQRN